MILVLGLNIGMVQYWLKKVWENDHCALKIFRMDYVDFNLNEAGPSQQPKMKKRGFSKEEKRCFISLMKSSGETIWNKGHTDHKNKLIMERVWRHISRKMFKSVAECKSTWKSLRDSHRYHFQKSRKMTTGSACDLEDDTSLESKNVSWEFSEDLSFLRPASSLRKTFSSTTISSQSNQTQETMFEDFELVEAELLSGSFANDPETPILESSRDESYFYNAAADPIRPKKRNMETAHAAEKVAEQLGALVSLRMQEAQKKEPPKLKYRPMLEYIDSLLQLLPENVARNLGHKFTTEALEAVNAQTDSTLQQN